MVGFKVDEIMVGTHRFVSGKGTEGEQPLHFSITWGNKNLLEFLNPFSDEFLFSRVRGFITVKGLVDRADCEGSLHLMYFNGRKIRYELDFTADDGKAYRYVGEKTNIWPWNIYRTHRTCYGTVTPVSSGDRISDSVVYFPYREAIGFVLSARLCTGELFEG
ncbi:MAG: hypothetical protein U9P80_06325 [Thermodesulfobacteriota bacterium]|nr:hypothetical protein [Thermodesulfobacteriota bacterium]